MPGEREQRWPEREAPLIHVLGVGNGTVVSISDKNEAIFWSSKDARESRRIKLPEDQSVHVAPNGQYAVSLDGVLPASLPESSWLIC